MADNNILEQFNKMQQTGALSDLAALRRENRELEKIITDAALLITNSNVDGMLQFMISRILDHFIPQFLAFIIEPPRGKNLREYTYRNLKEVDDKIPARYYDLLKEHFMHTPAAASFKDLEKALGEENFGDDFRRYGPELIYPMHGIGGLYGLVILGKKFTADEYGELEKLYMDRMIRFLSVSIQNGLHHESSITDPKTSLFNYDYFISRVEEEIAHAGRHGVRSGMLILDVDKFKNFNDTHGHVAGDEALVTLANVLRKSTRAEDCVSRFGGEEFSILIANCNSALLKEIAERIRKSVEETPIHFESKKLNITVSIGARMIEFTPGRNAVNLLEDADKALYNAKEGGRNRVVLYASGFLGRAEVTRKGMQK